MRFWLNLDGGTRSMKAFSFAAFLFLLWILLSGHFTPLLLCLGIASVTITVIIATRMKVIDHESYPLQLSSKLPSFLLYIMREIVKANIDVIKRILKSDGKTISPQLIEIPVPQKTDLGRVIYANAITLTPGTVCVELEKDKMIVHALTEEGAKELLSGDMAKMIPDQENKK